jgi:protein SHQ1
MITPNFKVNQDSNFLYITMKLKYVKFSEVEFFIENNNFRFHLKPYYLNLYFSDNLKAESEKNNSKYDVDSGILECKIEKETPDSVFKDLDLIGNLFEKGKSEMDVLGKKVEELNIGCSERINYDNFTKDKLNELISKHLGQQENGFERFGYGFENGFNDVFKGRQEELFELCDVDPDTIAIEDRYFYKIGKENQDFNEERYAYDAFMEEEVTRLCDMEFKLPLTSEYSDKDLQVLLTLNKTKLSHLEESAWQFYLEVIDIVFAYFNDQRITEYESNSESAWCINKLSTILSSLCSYKGLFYTRSKVEPIDYIEESLKNVLVSNYRRALTYPLYRSFELCNAVKNDLCKVLDKGIVGILKSMLAVRSIFEKSEPRHLLNKCYIDLYCKWLQQESQNQVWKIISEVIQNLEITKDDLKLNLQEIENSYLENN